MSSGLYFVLAVLLSLLGSMACDKGTEPPPFKRDPNLQQLTFHDYDKPGAKWRGDTFFPVWALDDKIYYTRSNDVINPAHQFGGGDLWVIDRTEETDTLLVKGLFGSLDLSPDGRWLLAVDKFTFCSTIDWAEGVLALFDLSTMEKRIISTGTLKVLEAAFCPDSTGLAIVYYGYRSSSSPDGYYRIHVDGTDNQLLYARENFVSGNYGNGLDVSWDGRKMIYLSENGRSDGMYPLSYPPVIKDLVTLDQTILAFNVLWPRFNSDGSKIVCIMHDGLGGPIGIIDAHDGSLIETLDIEAYDRHRLGRTQAFFPCWSPDGTNIVFSGTYRNPDGGNPHAYDLWILSNLY